jgi:uncharacterized protein (TIGR02271 family)
MIDESNARQLIGTTAYSADGDKLGKVGQVFLDDATGRPEFVTVQTGLFGTNESFVPVSNASPEADRLVVPFSKDQVKDAPNVDVASGHLDEEEERRLYEHYNHGTDADVVGHDVSGPTTDDAMTRSEEQVRVGTTSQEAGRVRLRKYVVTEQETHTVPVRKEKAVLEREPITERNVGAATSGPDISEEEHEVILREERPVVDKTVEPVERVRLGTEETTEEQRVTEQVRKERIETDGDLDDRT